MALQQFTWLPTNSGTGEINFSVNKAGFGDGYSQSVARGINNGKQLWPLTFTYKKVDAQAIREFLDGHKGAKSFAWKPPLGMLSLWTCEQYSFTPLGADVYRINATFEQVFHP